MRHDKKFFLAFTQNTGLPEIVTKKADAAFAQILAEENEEKAAGATNLTSMKKHKNSHRKHIPVWAKALSAAAAVLLLAFGFFASNPVLAAKLPVIGHLFSMLAEDFGYPGDYTPYAEPLEKLPDSSNTDDSAAATTSWSQTVNGVTVTLSEVYCNQESLSLSMLIESEEPFRDKILQREFGNQSFYLKIKASFSFQPDVMAGNNQLEGRFLDEKSFAGIWRVDLSDVLFDRSEINRLAREVEAAGEEFPITREVLDQYGRQLPLPDQFDLTICLNQIIGELAEQTPIDWGMSDEELIALSDEEFKKLHAEKVIEYGMDQFPNAAENYWFDGPWNFTVPVTVNSEGNRTVSVHDIQESGLGLNEISVTPFELCIDYEDSGSNCIPILLDAQGNWMEPADSFYTLPIADHDTTTITFYLCDFEQWANEISQYSRQENYQQLLDQYALYRTEVDLSQVQE